MLTTAEIIDLYDKCDYDTIISNLNILDRARTGFKCFTFKPIIPTNKFSRPLQIFKYAMDNIHIDLVTYMLLNTPPWFNIFMEHMVSDKSRCKILETILKNNSELCTIISNNEDMYSTLDFYKIPKNNDIELLNICIIYLSSDYIIIPLLCDAINFNNLQMIDILADAGFDVKSAFDTYVMDGSDNFSLSHPTCTWLQKYDIDLFIHIDRLAQLFCEVNNLFGFIFCLEMGANINYAIVSMCNPSLEMIKCILENGIDVTWFNKSKIETIIKSNRNGLDIIVYLMSMGLNMSDYIHELMFVMIGYTRFEILKYFIKLGTDIHFDNEILLYYSANIGRIEPVEILLENGADVHVRNDSILSFGKSIIPKCLLNKYNVRYITPYLQARPAIDKILIKYGAIIDDYTHIFCRYIRYIKDNLLDMEYLTYLLDKHIDLNTIFNDDMYQSPHNFYIFEAIICYGPIELIKLCMEYGADPFINNHGPLRTGIIHNKLDAVKILLDMGSRANIEVGCNVDPDMINLLNRYDISFKKID